MIRIYFSKLKNNNLEITEKMLTDILSYMKRQDDNIEKLNKGYCPIKEKCNKGECDCTNEEYNQMCEENIKLDLEIERLNNIINKVLFILEHMEDDRVGYEVCIDILKGVEPLTENDKKQVKWLKDELKVGDEKQKQNNRFYKQTC